MSAPAWTTAGGPDSAEVVSCGVPLRCLEVRAPAGWEAAGPIAVRGASLLAGYLGHAASPLDGGWLASSDLGFLSEGELYVVGRADDVLVIAGRKLYPELLEETASRHQAVRAGNCSAISDGLGGYLIVAERRRASAGSDMPDACGWIRRELSVRGGVRPTAVVIVSPGSIPKDAERLAPAQATRPAAQARRAGCRGGAAVRTKALNRIAF